MPLEQAPPQAAPEQAGPGPEVLKEAAAGIMQQAQTMRQAADAFAQGGAPEGVSVKIAQAADLIESAMQELGVTGGAPQEGPQPAPGSSPDVAGGAAVPETMAR